jgi:carbon monoxide dehydrogenase subunit G
MKIANEFTVRAPIEDAWNVLTDLEQVIPLMPGAQMTGREGDDVLGKVKVKVGPVTSEFSGKVHFVEQDRDEHRAVIDGKGKESRGTGNAAATVTAQLHDAGDHTRVTVDTDLKVVGKLAQFGSSMLQQVSEKLLGQFVESLEAKLVADNVPSDPATSTPAADPAHNGMAPRAVAPPQPEAEPIDLLELAGGGALKKYGPPVFGAFLIAALLFALRRLRIARKALRRR